MRLVLVFMCLLGLSLAASLEKTKKPRHCKSPPLLTGAFSYVTQNEEVWAYAPFEYDAFGERIRIYEVGAYQNQSFTYDALLLYQEGLMYQIDHKTQKCVKQELKGDFPFIGVPHEATLLGSAVIGSSSGPGQGLLVNSWTGKRKTGEKYMMTFTDVHCVPVTIAYQVKDVGWAIMSFMNNVEGIADPNALNPPKFCLGQDVQTEEEPVDLFTVIRNIRKNGPDIAGDNVYSR